MIETGLLQNLVGYKDAVPGAHVISITAGEDSISEVIEISMQVDPEQADLYWCCQILANPGNS